MVDAMTYAFFPAAIAATSPSALDPHGSEAHRLAGVWWLVFGLGAFVAVVVLVIVLVAMFRRRTLDGSATARTQRRFIIGGGLVFPAVVLTIVAVVTIDSTATLRRSSPNAQVVDVVGEQWFWRVSYPDTGITTANQVRLPVDRPAELHLHATDVIHSFWVPQLAGKLDLTPGESPVLRFTPQAVGTFRGECAEFCGLQHANMNFAVEVMTQSDFDAWVRDHRSPPPRPTDPLAIKGREDFATLACAGCHTIRGLTDGTVGPDLTDVGDRSTLGALTVPNDDAHLATWINNARLLKPGAKMPPIDLTPDQVTALVAFLRTLR
jgi:cytochrome c oxidase subunit 2